MAPWHVLLGLPARRPKPRIIRYSQGRSVTDTRNDVAVEYVSTRTLLPYMMICCNLWVVYGVTAFNSRLSLAAQTAILAKAKNNAAEALSAAAGLELIQAEVAGRMPRSGAGTRATTSCPATTWRRW